MATTKTLSLRDLTSFGDVAAEDDAVLDYFLTTDAVDRINRVGRGASGGQRRVRIHAVGFPMPERSPQLGNYRYAALMRALCERNGGTFVGLIGETPKKEGKRG